MTKYAKYLTITALLGVSLLATSLQAANKPGGNPTAQAQAPSLVNLPLNGSWTTLDQDMGGVDGTFFGNRYSWFSSYPVRFTIVGWLIPTDIFEVYDHNAPFFQGWQTGAYGFVFQTPLRPDFIDYGQLFSTDADFCLRNNRYFSAYTYVFPAGWHVLAIKDVSIAGTFTDGSVAFKAEIAWEAIGRR